MIGEALSWFKWMFGNHQLSTWNAFTKALELRFGPSSSENHQATLFKLQQRGSVFEYQVAFEKLSNRILGLSHDTLLNCFISGLKVEIQREIAILKPHSLSPNPWFRKTNRGQNPRPTPTPPFPCSYPQPALLPKPPSFSPFPIRRLNPAEMQAHRAKGLCFNCNDRWHSPL